MYSLMRIKNKNFVYISFFKNYLYMFVYASLFEGTKITVLYIYLLFFYEKILNDDSFNI